MSHSTLRLAIIADDLTGALDAAAPFAGRSLATVVATNVGDIPDALARGPAILAVNTASREIAPDRAGARVAQAISYLPAGVQLFKKVDSRLKGNIAAELDAFSKGPVAVLPAIPEFARYVRGGAVTGFGVKTPIAIAPHVSAWSSVYAPDTGSVAELAQALNAAPEGALLVGARGLADALAQEMAQRPSQPASVPLGPISFVIGSRDPITCAQVAALRDAFPKLLAIEAPNGVALDAPARDSVPALTLLWANAGPAPAAPDDVARSLADSLARYGLSERESLVLSGGATAHSVLEALGVGVLSVAGEVMAGLPVSRAHNCAIMTKSGGFGNPDCLVTIARAATGS